MSQIVTIFEENVNELPRKLLKTSLRKMILWNLLQICNGLKSKEWNEIQTNDGTYSVRDDQWASYLRPEEVFTIGVTAAMANLRGAGLWAIDLDDWRGECACSQPLLTALRQGLLEPMIPLSFCP